MDATALQSGYRYTWSMLTVLDVRTDSVVKLPRPKVDVVAAVAAVEPIMQDVRERGAIAVHESSEKFDHVRPRQLRVPAERIARALANLPEAERKAMERAIDHIRKGHEAQLPRRVDTEIIPGGVVTQRWIPVQRVGLYVPGGLAVYPSSVIMNAVAAQVAGVKSIALASPANATNDGYPHPTILAACALLGIDEVYAAGGASAVALFAYGAEDADPAESCAPVDVITGPGNIFVAAAKRIASAVCGIDAEAGTTEIAIVADADANPRFVAYDLVSQAEHDPAAASVLITDSAALISAVETELEQIVPAAHHSERIKTALSGPQSGAILTRDLAQSLAVADAYGAEHLEIHTVNADHDADTINNAGAIFVGPYTPVPVGDYIAGSNHVLPTGGTARYRAGLSIMAFIKPVQQIRYSAAGLADVAADLRALADAENLPSHADAVEAREGNSDIKTTAACSESKQGESDSSCVNR